VEQVAQRGCGGSVLRDHPGLAGHGPEQPVLAAPAPVAGLHEMI